MSITDCADPLHFRLLADGSLAPQPWMQLRRVRTTSVASKAGSYNVSGGVAKNDTLQTLTLAWTNTSPVAQRVYGLVTRGGSRMVISSRSRAVLAASHGLALGAATPTMYEESRFGTGFDRGVEGFGSNLASYGVVEYRQGARTTLLRPTTLVGDMLVAPGAVVSARFTLAFRSLFWENLPVGGGDGESESSYITGDSRMDLFAYPAL